MAETIEMILSLILALSASSVLFYTIIRWSKFPLVPVDRAPERTEEITEPTKRRKGSYVQDFRESIDTLVVQEARVLAQADYDRIADVQEVDVANRARELADKWWLGDLTLALQRLDGSYIPPEEVPASR